MRIHARGDQSRRGLVAELKRLVRGASARALHLGAGRGGTGPHRAMPNDEGRQLGAPRMACCSARCSLRSGRIRDVGVERVAVVGRRCAAVAVARDHDEDARVAAVAAVGAVRAAVDEVKEARRRRRIAG